MEIDEINQSTRTNSANSQVLNPFQLLLKISLAGIIKDYPNIDADRLINHLYEFYYRSQAVNQEFLPE